MSKARTALSAGSKTRHSTANCSLRKVLDGRSPPLAADGAARSGALPGERASMPTPRVLRVRRGAGIQRRPFVAPWRELRSHPAPFWAVPASGGYIGGYETGEAMALCLLKDLRNDLDDSPECSQELTWIVESMMCRFEQEGGQSRAERRPDPVDDGFASFQGQYVGFLNTIGMWLRAAARQIGGSLDGISERDLVGRANAGLRFDPERLACVAGAQEKEA